jgi:hypothetical protein
MVVARRKITAEARAGVNVLERAGVDGQQREVGDQFTLIARTRAHCKNKNKNNKKKKKN